MMKYYLEIEVEKQDTIIFTSKKYILERFLTFSR